MTRGIDISYHNGTIDFRALKRAGYDFVIPRDGWGEEDIDPRFCEYVKQAKAAGIAVPGVYHFIYGINIKEAEENARQAIKNVQAAGLPTSTVIWCDLEYDTVDNARDYRDTDLTPEHQARLTATFCDYILRHGYPTGFYANQDYMQRVYGRDFLQRYDLWLADLEGGTDYPCVIRQDSHTATLPGIVDTDTYYGQYTAGTAKEKKMGISPFKDVKPTDSKYKYIKKCYDAGLVKGYSDGTFRPTEPVTRDDACIMISRVLDKIK